VPSDDDSKPSPLAASVDPASRDERPPQPRAQRPADALVGTTLAHYRVEAVPEAGRAEFSTASGLRDHVAAQLDLAQALEQTGDVPGACRAYAEVLDRWGHAVPRSVSAEAARDGSRRLRCSP